MNLNTDKNKKTSDKYVTDNRTLVHHPQKCSFLLPCGMCEKTNKHCPLVTGETIWFNNNWYGGI